MRNILINISYDGSKFFGFQRQPDKRTVQGELEKAIKEVTGQTVNLIPCGRTDAGVHAKEHISNFFIETNLPAISLKYHLRRHLPKDIVIIETREVDIDFHARFDAKSKIYRYIVSNGKYEYPYYRKYKTFVSKNLDLEKMILASKKLLGFHDFTAFMKWGEDKNPVRKIDEINIYRVDEDIYFEYIAESFLHNQIRIMTGLLIDIGRGFREISYIDDIFDKKIERAAKTYGPEGLYLLKINY